MKPANPPAESWAQERRRRIGSLSATADCDEALFIFPRVSAAASASAALLSFVGGVLCLGTVVYLASAGRRKTSPAVSCARKEAPA